MMRTRTNQQPPATQKQSGAALIVGLVLMMVLTILALIDLVLVGSLVVMVMFSGYENFVSRLDSVDAEDGLNWLGKMDSGGLKNKVAASIVAISSIHLLKIFMNAHTYEYEQLKWFVIIHMTFVVSAIGMAYVDKINKH